MTQRGAMKEPARMRAVATAGRSPVGVRGALLLALIGCGGTAEPCTGGDTCELEGQVQVATWWGTRGELYVPFEVLTQSLRRSTGLEAKLAHKLQTKGEHTAWVEEQLDEETLSPKPLDVFSANNGDEVLRWTPCAASGAPPASPKLLGLTNPQLGLSALDPGWIQDNFRPEVMRTLECYGETYALPVGIHRINTLFFNKALFRAAGYAVDGGAGEPLPSSLDELHTAAAALSEHLPPAAAGSLVPPSVFAVAGREAWTLSLFVIENLMLSLAADAAHYERYWTGEACDEDLARYPADDGPAYLTILLVGHLIVAPLLFFPIVWESSPAISLPAILIPLAAITLLALPRVKGAWIGLMYALGVKDSDHRFHTADAAD